MQYNIKLGDGRKGWVGRLQDFFDEDLDLFILNDPDGVISKRLGHTSPEEAWKKNPVVVRAPELCGIYPEGHVFS